MLVKATLSALTGKKGAEPETTPEVASALIEVRAASDGDVESFKGA